MIAMLDDRTKGLIRALLYPVQFEKRPEEGIARVVDLVVKQDALQASQADYLNAIDIALGSEEKLSELLPRSHDEETVRRFLSKIGNVMVGQAA
jgi:hypothetical protein